MSIALPTARVAIGIIAAAWTFATAAPSRAGSLSDMLNQRIADAQRAESDRKYDAALTTYTDALQITAVTPAAKRLVLRKRAALYEQLNMPEQAEADLTAVMKVAPFDPGTLVDRGYFYMRQGRFSEALDDFVDGSRTRPKDAIYLYGAGRVLVAAHDDANAIKFYNEAIELAPNEPKFHLARAEALLREQKYGDAQTDYERALALGMTDRSDRYFGFVGRGYVNVMRADFGMAVQAFSQALSIYPDSPNVLLWRGFAYERQGARDLALRDYERAAAGMPNEAQPRIGAARLRSRIAGDLPPTNPR